MNLMIGTDPAEKGGIASVVTLLMNESFLSRYKIKYITSHEYGSLGYMTLLALRAYMLVFGHCLLFRPKIVHVHSASRGSFIRKSTLLAIARLFGCKTIFHLHDGEFMAITQASGAFKQWWTRRTLQKSTKVIVLSETDANAITQFAPGSQVQIIYNAVKVEPLNDLSLEQEGRILFLGNAGPRKGIFELLTAIAELKKNFPGIKLVIAGDGNLAEVLTKARELGIEPNIEILGWINADQKKQELAKASVFILPSRAEGLPMSMLEAMSANKAVAVSNVGGIPHVVKDGENGLLMPPADVAAITATITKLLENKAFRIQLALNARKTIVENYSSETVIKKLSTLYVELGAAPQI
ncbi:MAG: glycosyltransferase family 4 protein [Methylococcales bacterium]